MTNSEWNELDYWKPNLNNAPIIGSTVELENRPTFQYELTPQMAHNNILFIIWSIKTFGRKWREGRLDDPNPVWHGINEEPTIPESGAKYITVQARERQIISIKPDAVPDYPDETIADVIKSGRFSLRWRYVSQPYSAQVANLDFKYDMSPVVLWQYDNAPKLKKLVDYQQKFLDVAITQWEEEFNKNIFDLRTCDANGLELWGRLLQVSRPVVNNVQFNDEQYRLLLQSRMFITTFDGSAFSLTTLIHKLFPNAIFTVVDNGNMTATISIAGGITDEQRAVFNLGYIDPVSGVFVHTFLPRPAGVKYDVNFDSDWATVLGFDGMTETTNMGGTYNNNPGDHEGTTGIENPDGGVFYN